MDDQNERKRLSNKLSQRKHRIKQQHRLKELEEQNRLLTEKLNSCIYNNSSKQELRKIRRAAFSRIEKISGSLNELKDFLNSDLFAAIADENDELLEDDLNNVQKDYALNGELNDNIILQNNEKQYNNNHFHSVSKQHDSLHQQMNEVPQIYEIDAGVNNEMKDLNSYTLELNIPNTPQQQQQPMNVDANDILKCYLYNNLTSIPHSEEVINSIGNQFLSTINSIKYDNSLSKSQQLELIINSPQVLNMVCNYANELFEKIPNFQTYTFAYGGVKWLCGQILFFCTTNPYLGPLIQPLLFKDESDVVSKETLNGLVDNLYKILDMSWLNVNRFNRAIEPVNSHASESLVADKQKLLHTFFHPTKLQTYIIKKNSYEEYPHWINFIIWPEFRDLILSQLDELSKFNKDMIFHDLLENVILEIQDPTTHKKKMFFMHQFTTVLEYEMQSTKVGVGLNYFPPVELLDRCGLYNPSLWKVTRSYGLKYGKVVPKNLILWELDDKDEANIIIPHQFIWLDYGVLHIIIIYGMVCFIGIV